MKKIIYTLAIVAFGLTTLSSCTREHTCECISTDSNGDQTATKTVITGTKKKAEEECDKKDEDPVLGPKVECEIKDL